MSAPVQFEATLDAANRRKDRSITVRFTSMREMTTDEFAALDRLNGQAGWCLFKANELTDEEVPKDQAEDGRKTTSQRLWAVLFVYFKQLGEPGGDFNAFRRAYLEKQIDSIKGKLDPEET